MKKVGFSLKKLGAIFLGLVLLFLLFSMFGGSREGFACSQRSTCVYGTDTTCTSGNGQTLTCSQDNKWKRLKAIRTFRMFK